MEYVTIYRCSYCGKTFTTTIDCLKHEANLFGLSVLEYKHWLNLQKEEERTAHRMQIEHNEETIEANDKAVDATLAFEKEHGLTDDKIESIKRKDFFNANKHKDCKL